MLDKSLSSVNHRIPILQLRLEGRNEQAHLACEKKDSHWLDLQIYFPLEWVKVHINKLPTNMYLC